MPTGVAWISLTPHPDLLLYLKAAGMDNVQTLLNTIFAYFFTEEGPSMPKHRHPDKAGARPALPLRKWTWGLVLLLCATFIASCGASPSSAQTLSSTPQATPGTGPFHATIQTFDGAFAITLDINPTQVGSNTFMLSVLDRHTAQPATSVDVMLYTTMQDMAMGTDSFTLHSDGNGKFSATSGNLDMGGHWAIGITITTPDRVIHQAGVKLVIS